MLKNQEVNIKIKLSLLWASATFCYLYGDYFELYTPEKINSMVSGENVLNTPVNLLLASIILAIPSLMVAISVFAAPKLNRLLNMLFGLIFTLMMLLIGAFSLTEWYSFYVFLAFLESIITFTIFWTALKWPKDEVE